MMVNFPCLIEGRETAFGRFKLSGGSRKLGSAVNRMIMADAEKLSEK